MNIIRNETRATRKLLTKLYGHHSANQTDKAAAIFADDIRWHPPGSAALFPFSNPLIGRDNLVRMIEGVKKTFEILSVEPKMIMAEGNMAVVNWTLVTRHRESGHGTAADVCSILSLNGEHQVTEIWDYGDAATATLHLAGHGFSA